MPGKYNIERIKGSGPGGQHRNKRETGIRATDPETGLTATATTSRHQSINLKNAVYDLEQKIAKRKKRKKKRVKTKPTKQSKETRLKDKKYRSKLKQFPLEKKSPGDTRLNPNKFGFSRVSP